MARASRRPLRAGLDALEPRRLMAATELVTNGNFAANATGWTISGNFAADARFSNARSAPGYAYLAAPGGGLAASNNLVGTLRQTVTIPADATSAALRFYYNTNTEETAGTNDSVALRLKTPAGATLATPVTLYNETTFGYVSSATFDLRPYAGQSVVLSFEGATNATAGSVFRIDDVSLIADVPDAPPPAPLAFVVPTLVSPGGLPTPAAGPPAVNTPVPTFRWNAVTGATGYGLKVERLNATTGAYATAYDSASLGRTISGTTFTVPTPLAAGTYRWTVRAFEASGAATGFAPALGFALNTTGYTRAMGIDISHWQGAVNWPSIKANGAGPADDTSFAWVKATESDYYTDDYYATNMANARAAGVPIGGYHFARPTDTIPLQDGVYTLAETNADAVKQADHFTGVLAGELLPGNLRPVLDLEATGGLNKATLSAWANAFCDRVLAVTGLTPLIYVGSSFANDFLDATVVRFTRWMLRYLDGIDPNTAQPGATTAPWPSWAFWQYTQTGSVAGVAGNVDRDVFNGDVAALANFKIPSAAAGTIAGTLFDDRNQNAARDAGEGALASRTVFLDADGDALLDPGERTTTTGATGAYAFSGLPEGAYTVRQIVPAGFFATTPAARAVMLAPAAVAGGQDFGSRNADVTPPAVVASRFAHDVAAHPVTLTFGEDVGATLANADATLVDVATNVALATTMTYDAATRTATFAPAAPLANARYRLTIAAGAVADAAGNATAAAMHVDFFWLEGDADRDGVVGFADLVALAQNYGGTGRTYAQGDLTYDGAVDFADLVRLAQNYGATLQPSAVNVAAVTVASGGVATKTTRRRASADVLA